jgi:hypothetical protein
VRSADQAGGNGRPPYLFGFAKPLKNAFISGKGEDFSYQPPPKTPLDHITFLQAAPPETDKQKV